MHSTKLTLVYYDILGFQKATLQDMHKHFEVIVLSNPDHDNNNVLEKADIVFAPMGFVFDKRGIDRCENLKVIATPTTGLVHIDVDYAKSKNITICSLKDQQKFLATITPTAELAWGLILATTRRIISAHKAVCQGEWEGKSFGKRIPRMLSNMSLGVIGLGRLGSLVAKYGQAFGMNVFYYDPFITNDLYEKCLDLNALAKKSDIVSVHVHLNEETENCIDENFIQSMPQGSYIINTARGGLVNEQALLNALESGHLGGAGLDMLKGEHLPEFKGQLEKHPLIQYARAHDNLIITPKIGGCTVDAWEKTEKRLVDMIIKEIKGKVLVS